MIVQCQHVFALLLRLPELLLARKNCSSVVTLSLYSSAHAMLMLMVIMILITSLFQFLVVESEGRDGLNIPITCVPERGYLNPKLYLTERLAARGHRVTLAVGDERGAEKSSTI